MNGMVDFVSNFNLFLSNKEEQVNEEIIENENMEDRDFHNREKPKTKKKPLNKIFRMDEKKNKKKNKK